MISRALSATAFLLALFLLLIACGYSLGYADASANASRDIPVCRAQTFPQPFKGTLP